MSESYYMSIQLSLDGLSFCALDPVTNVFMALTDVSFGSVDLTFAKHEQYLLSNSLFGRRFRKVLVSIESPAFSMLPNSLFDEKQAADVLALTGIKVRSDDKVLRNNIELASATTLFSVPNFLYFFLRSQFQPLEIYHSTTPIVSSMLLKRQHEEAALHTLNISLSEGSMTVVATKRNEILLCNRFYCKDSNDYVYMTLFVMNQLGMDIATTNIVVSGNVGRDDSRIRTLMRFSRHVEFASTPSFFDYAFEVPDNAHKFNSLFLMPLCVS